MGSYSNLKPKGHDQIDVALLPHSIIMALGMCAVYLLPLFEGVMTIHI